MKIFIVLVIFFILEGTFISGAVEIGDGFKNSLVALNAEKVQEMSTIINKNDLENLVVVKKGIGKLLDSIAVNNGNFDDSSIARGIGTFIIGVVPEYKYFNKTTLERKTVNGDCFLKYISWDVKRFLNNKYVFVLLTVNVAASVDTFVYGFEKIGGQWIKVFENDDPDFLDTTSGRCSYDICTFVSEKKQYFLLVNTFANVTSSVGQILFSVYCHVADENKLKIIFGPKSESAFMPDPENPYTVTVGKGNVSIKFICDRDTDANSIWSTVELKAINGKIVESRVIQK